MEDNKDQELEKLVRIRTKELVDSNDILTREIAKSAKIQNQLEASLKEKEVLLKEVHHRVKNNLQLILSLLKLQHRRSKNISADELVMEVHNRVRSISLLHEMMYRAEDLGSLNLIDYASSLAEQLLRFYGKTQQVILKIEGDGVHLDIDSSIPCGLILSELISNSLKHAFPGGKKGEILIRIFEESDGSVILSVSDNGIGFSPKVDPQELDSLGFELVRKLTKQLKGELKFNREGGTNFEINFSKRG